jgi:glycosyltransferase involved in cell wall biosynthesis
MRILELLSSPAWTGPAEPMASVAPSLVARGHRVEVAVDTIRPGDLRSRLRGIGLAVRDDLALSTKAGPLAYVRDIRRLRCLVRDVDVAHAHFSHDHGLALLARRGRPDVRVVRTVHSSRSLARRLGQGLAHRRTDGLLAVCESHARLLSERFGVPERRIGIARGAVDTARFTPDGPDLRGELGLAPGTPVAGIVSRVKPDRRHAELVDAFRRVADALPDARLVVVGRGEGLDAVRAHVEACGLADRVVFAGYRTGEALAAAYRTLDVKVLLAEGNDGTCRALLEAMACGRPGVAYRFGAPAETIADGTTGLLVADGDVRALAAALVELLSWPAHARAMGAAARGRVAALYTESARGEAVERFLADIGRMPPA